MELFYPEKIFNLSTERKLFFSTICIHRAVSIYKTYIKEYDDENSWRMDILNNYYEVESNIIRNHFKITDDIYNIVKDSKEEFNRVVDNNINTEDEDAEEEQIVLNAINAIDEYFDIILEKEDIQGRMYLMLMDCSEVMSFNSDYDEESLEVENEWQMAALDMMMNTQEEFPFREINNLNEVYNKTYKEWIKVELLKGEI